MTNQSVNIRALALELRGNFDGTVTLSHGCDGTGEIGRTEIRANLKDWSMKTVRIDPVKGKGALYLHFTGFGSLDLKSLAFLSE